MTRAQNEAVAELDPAARPMRRTYTAEYKARILAAYEALPDHSPEREGAENSSARRARRQGRFDSCAGRGVRWAGR